MGKSIKPTLPILSSYYELFNLCHPPKQKREGWGTKVIDWLACDLQNEFSNMKGFLYSNLKYMRAFAEALSEEAIVQQLVAQIPWGHNVKLLDMVSDKGEREWYAGKTVENGWSRNVLPGKLKHGLLSVEELKKELGNTLKKV